MAMKKLSFLDSVFLLAENRKTPMHVGGVNLFTLPAGVDEQEFLHGVAQSLRYGRRISATVWRSPEDGSAGSGRPHVLGAR